MLWHLKGTGIKDPNGSDSNKILPDTKCMQD